MKRFIRASLLQGLVLWAPVAGLSFTTSLVPIAAQAQTAGPSAQIERLNQALLGIMKQGSAVPFPQRYQTLAPVVQQVLDLPLLLKNSVGLKWNSLTPEQQSRLLDVFTRFTVARYVSEFSSFDGQSFRVSPNPVASGSDQVVQSQIVSDGTANRIDYLMRNDGGQWKVVDVLLDGSISQVAVTRSDFRTLLAAGPDNLLDKLRQKISDLSGGTM
ncbi:Toluene transport system Ttg2D protein [Granulibacter bethesdensis]|uniref:Toluene transport system Ttg2D protein n=1 Tax=Granulibacter bethesdensis TaxID=364410 RepID=A0AAC9KC41_9PROT|nr:ABC transporter substrate-binding protein [Granulibacter bethesdensis]APH55737.1 Toluene transport system Ttg2D protein [Granulibacter bethesdensis]APH63322.1 Toluene transport system Ttg2D protein [Granulibacter bethesdensis]